MSNRPDHNRNMKKQPQSTQQQIHVLREKASSKLNETHRSERELCATEMQPQPQTSPTPSSKPRCKRGGYTAPDGTYLCDKELARLGNGIENPKSKCVIYFQPSFLEDPWKDLKAMEIAGTLRWCRFYVCDGVYVYAYDGRL
ncbi:hypothetical protein BBP40_004662 [Aspergillus hancockii]|nr:hypothetical protein BBP40_004662 [Aspergillus hancockii]